MGMLNNGQWQEEALVERNEDGSFVRQMSAFRGKITTDPQNPFQPEAGRYHLYISYACPWASRTLIFRTLKGLEDVISLSSVDPHMQDKGWEFGVSDSDTADPINHAHYLSELYVKADPHYTGRVTVPVLWDKKNQTVVNNESSAIMRMLNSAFNAFATNSYDFYPEALQKDIDDINEFIYENVNNGVYKCGFADTQQAYDEAFDALFNALEVLEQRLSKQRYLVGKQITEADWRLFPTLIRFDSIYVGHFKCNLKRIEDCPNLANYLREFYQVPGIKQTVNLPEIKAHYYKSHLQLNPTGIVPKGPAVDYDQPHDRDRF